MTRALVLALVVGLAGVAPLGGCRSHRSTHSATSAGYSTSATRANGITASVRTTSSDEPTPYDGPFDDQHFVEHASLGGLFEVESSRLALEQRSSEQTREFARLVIEEQGRTNQELASLALEKRLGTAVGLDAYHTEKLDELRRLEGAEFDAKYKQCQIKAHDEAIALFDRATRDCRDLYLQAFAARTLPVLRERRARLESPVIEKPQR